MQLRVEYSRITNKTLRCFLSKVEMFQW